MTCSKKSDGTWLHREARRCRRPGRSARGRAAGSPSGPRPGAGRSQRRPASRGSRGRCGRGRARRSPGPSPSSRGRARAPPARRGWKLSRVNGPDPTMPPVFQTVLKSLPFSTCSRQHVVAAGDAEDVPPGGVVALEGHREAGRRRAAPARSPCGPGVMAVIWSQPVVLAIWLPRVHHRAPGERRRRRSSPARRPTSARPRRRWNVTRSGPSTTSSPEGTDSASCGTYAPVSSLVSRFWRMFETTCWAATVAPSARSGLRIGGAWSSASISVPPRTGSSESSPEPQPQPARRAASSADGHRHERRPAPHASSPAHARRDATDQRILSKRNRAGPGPASVRGPWPGRTS